MASNRHMTSLHPSRVLGMGVACLLLSACGFQLRGMQYSGQNSAWKTMQVDCPDTEKFFCDRLRDQLIQSGISVEDVRLTERKPFASEPGILQAKTPTDPLSRIVDKPQTPQASELPLLHIGSLSSGRRAVTLTANAGAAEFEISREVEFSLSQSGDTLVKSTKLRQYQTYRYDSSSVLGKDQEEIQITHDLDNMLAYQVMNRVAIESIKLAELNRVKAETTQPNPALAPESQTGHAFEASDPGNAD